MSQDTNQYQKLFEMSVDMLGIANVEGYFEIINPAFEETLGWSEEKILSTPFVDFVHPDDIATTKQEIEKLSKGIKTIKFTNRYKTKSGEYKILSWNSTPSKDGKLYAVARDITEDVAREKLLKEKLEELDRFNKAMINREVKMMELKEENYNLKNKS